VERLRKLERDMPKRLISTYMGSPSHGRGRRFNPYSAHHLSSSAPPLETLLVMEEGRTECFSQRSAVTPSCHSLSQQEDFMATIHKRVGKWQVQIRKFREVFEGELEADKRSSRRVRNSFESAIFSRNSTFNQDSGSTPK
jgi:hypothetical protein